MTTTRHTLKPTNDTDAATLHGVGAAQLGHLAWDRARIGLNFWHSDLSVILYLDVRQSKTMTTTEYTLLGASGGFLGPRIDTFHTLPSVCAVCCAAAIAAGFAVAGYICDACA